MAAVTPSVMSVQKDSYEDVEIYKLIQQRCDIKVD
jgi:hypothetical protein